MFLFNKDTGETYALNNPVDKSGEELDIHERKNNHAALKNEVSYGQKRMGLISGHSAIMLPHMNLMYGLTETLKRGGRRKRPGKF